ncbi:MAG TPA: hypothetical protein EYG16_02300 [Deltaproteobacteria bacterium]|nr:hypothetical protein [Candidatus Binatota bacterium]HIL12484.1 hypothetical protein [Deltaproteobacteria bacterium]
MARKARGRAAKDIFNYFSYRRVWAGVRNAQAQNNPPPPHKERAKIVKERYFSYVPPRPGVFGANPIGVIFDPDDMLAHYEAGDPFRHAAHIGGPRVSVSVPGSLFLTMGEEPPTGVFTQSFFARKLPFQRNNYVGLYVAYQLFRDGLWLA